MRALCYCCFISILFFASPVSAQTQRIKAYFNSPVDTSVSSGVNAVYLNHALDDTLVAYINRAHYSIDVAVYNYVQSSSMVNIATAINQAFLNGIKVRWIYDSSSSNSGLSQLDNGIHTLASPTGSSYNIMHDKFMVIDAASGNKNDAVVWTGSCNWNGQQFNYDVNNVIIFQDSAFAHAYTTEFNEMWGDTGLTPNLALSKFGPFKTDNTQHSFIIDGTIVEQYFSPTDNTNDRILDVINSADKDLYFGIYTFTHIADANSIADKIQNQNVYAAGIIDQFSLSSSPYSILSPVMGNQLIVYTNSNSIYHSKMVIVDPCLPSSDPIVETGSHNWTITANSKNDENTVIIHNDTIANVYYQSFFQNFADLGGALLKCDDLSDISAIDNLHLNIYPNPANESFTISGDEKLQSQLVMYNSFGQQVGCWKLNRGENRINVLNFPDGIYFIKMTGSRVNSRKLIIVH